MSWWRVLGCAACCGVAVTIAVWSSGWRRGMPLLLEGVLRFLFVAIPLQAIDGLFGRTAFWCGAPLVAAASWFGRSPFGILNFLVLQWFGVRLQAEFNREAWFKGPRGRWWAGDAPSSGPIAWSLLRWVWPLTGWWSGYRYISRRPRECCNWLPPDED